jgi:hypothetical protein
VVAAEPEPGAEATNAETTAEPESAASADDRTAGGMDHGGGGIVLGLRGTHAAVTGGSDERGGFGLGLRGMVNVLHTEDGVSGKVQSDWQLGGGAGFEGRLVGQMTFGAALFDHDTPFLRGGLGGGIEGNDNFYFSHFELPVLELGYHHSSEAWVFELGMRGAATLTSRYRGGSSPTLRGGPAPSWGAFASTYAGPIWLDVTMMRVEQERPLTGGWGQICGGNYWAVCIDGAIYHGDLGYAVAVAEPVFTTYVGATLGFGIGGPWERELDDD